MIKRYLLFAGAGYYPDGGWLDFHESYDVLQDARDAGLALKEGKPDAGWKRDWFHVVDSETGNILLLN